MGLQTKLLCVYPNKKKQEEHKNNKTEALKPYPDMMRAHFYNDIGNRIYLHDVAKNHVISASKTSKQQY